MTTGKIRALTVQTFVGKVISLLFNVLSRFVPCSSSKEHVSFNSYDTTLEVIHENKRPSSIRPLDNGVAREKGLTDMKMK